MPNDPPPAGAAQAKPALPLLYRRIEPLSATRHGAVRLRGPQDFSFARGAGIVPITLGEFSIVARQYPIVFLPTRPGAPPLAAAALGGSPRENLFVGADGQWLQGFYVPAYLRRYPFITGDTQEAERKAIYLDVESPRVSQDEGVALYENGELSQLGKAAVEFCRQYHGQVLATAAFNAAISAADILVPRSYPTEGDAKPRKNDPAMMTVDEAKLPSIDDATYLKWRAQNWIGMLYLHLFSISNFAALMQLRKRRATAAAAAVTPAGNA